MAADHRKNFIYGKSSMAITRIKKTSPLRKLKGIKGKHHACRSPYVHNKAGACVPKSRVSKKSRKGKSRKSKKSRKSRR